MKKRSASEVLPPPPPPRQRAGFVCENVKGFMVAHRAPSALENAVMLEYRRTYANAFGYEPHGFHFIPFPSEPETVMVWFPLR